MAYGLTATGFLIKDFQTIKAELEAAYQAQYGSDIDVSEASVFGQMIGIQAYQLAAVWEMAGAVYSSFNPDFAEGVSLDGAVGLVGVARLPASQTEAYAVMYAVSGTSIPSGSLITQAATNYLFRLQDNILVSLAAITDVNFSVNTVSNAALYRITINGINCDYTSDGTATAGEIIAGLLAAIDAEFTTITVENNTTSGRFYATDGREILSVTLDAKLTAGVIGTAGRFLADLFGVLSAPEGTLTGIATPVAGWDTVNNIAPGATGRAIETDIELRTRRRSGLGIGSSTDEAIRTALLQEVANVINARVYSNRTDGVVSGRPAHSFEAIVQGGDDEDVAQKIWETMPSGIQSYGNTSVNIIDSTGSTQAINFSRPAPIYIWCELTVTRYTEETFPTNGDLAIKDAMVAYADDYQEAGVDVIRQRYFTPIYSVVGIKDVVLTMASNNSPTVPPAPGAFAEADIVIADNEIAVFATNRIEVEVL